MADEIKSQSPVDYVLHNMRNGPIPKHKRDRELAAFWADQFEKAWTADKKKRDEDAYMERLNEHRAFLEKESHNAGDLADWYIHSVMPDDKPVWTMEHLEELERDFWLIAKPMNERGA